MALGANGQQFVVENRAGRRQQYRDRSGGALRAGRLHAALGRPAERDQRSALREAQLQFSHRHRAVASINREPSLVQINPSLPVPSIPELIAYAKANPGKINHASAGTGPPATSRARCSR